MYPGTAIALKLHPRVTLSIALVLAVSGFALASIVTNYYLFIIFYGLFFGLSYSLSFSTPLMVAWSYFSRHSRGRISGIISAGFGLSSAVFNIITLKLVNPDNVEADIEIEHDSITSHYYGPEIADNTPSMLFNCAIILFCLGVVSIILTPNFRKIRATKVEPGDP